MATVGPERRRIGGLPCSDGLSAVASCDVQKWVTTLCASLGPSAVRQTHLALSGVMKFAIRVGRLARNPCDDVRLPRLVKQRRGYRSHEQVAALVDELGENGDVALFLAYTGLRWVKWRRCG